MTDYTKKVLQEVNNRKLAEELVTTLLVKFSGVTAWENIEREANTSKQSPVEATRRAVSNLFRRFDTRKK